MIFRRQNTSPLKTVLFSMLLMPLLISVLFTQTDPKCNDFPIHPQKLNKYLAQAGFYENSYGTVIDSYISEKSVSPKKYAVENDTASGKNKLTIRKEGSNYYCEVELEDYSQSIEISAYNLLGKRVKDVYRGEAIKNHSYRIDVTSLPNGLYICVVLGAKLRLTEKFIVSR